MREKRDALLGLQTQNTECKTVNVFGRRLKQLVTRHFFKDMLQRLGIVGAFDKAGAVDSLRHFLAHDGHFARAAGIGAGSKQAHKQMHALQAAIFAEDFDTHSIQRHAAMHGGVLFNQFADGDRPARFGQQGHFRAADVFAKAQFLSAFENAKVGALHNREARPFLARSKSVFAVAKEGEVVGLDVVQEFFGFFHIGSAMTLAIQFGRGKDFIHARQHFAPVRRGAAHIGQRMVKRHGQFFAGLRRQRLFQMDMHMRFRDVTAGHRLAGLDIRQLPCLVAAGVQNRVQQQIDVHALIRQLRRHRVDDERHVVVDDLNDGAGHMPAVAFLVGVEHAQFMRAHFACLRPSLHRCGNLRQLRRGKTGDVFCRYMAEEHIREMRAAAGGLACRRFAGCRARGFGAVFFLSLCHDRLSFFKQEGCSDDAAAAHMQRPCAHHTLKLPQAAKKRCNKSAIEKGFFALRTARKYPCHPRGKKT